MTFLSGILPKYRFISFDEKNEKIQTQSLNIFQCFMRKAFGCHKETHLQHVLDKAYFKTFTQGNIANEDVPLFLELFAKGQEKGRGYDLEKGHVLKESGTLDIKARYHIATRNENNSLIGLSFEFTHYTTETLSYSVSFCRDPQENLYFRLPKFPFSFEKEAAQSSFRNLSLNMIFSFVGKLVEDSGSSLVTEPYFYGFDYMSNSGNLTASSENILQMQNQGQEKAMQKRGWRKTGNTAPGSILYEREDSKKLTKCDFVDKDVSIAFLAQHIK